jgi:hypothetical protein
VYYCIFALGIFNAMFGIRYILIRIPDANGLVTDSDADPDPDQDENLALFASDLQEGNKK